MKRTPVIAYVLPLLGAAVLGLGGGVAKAISLDLVPTVQSVAQGGVASVAVRISGLGDGTAPSLGAFDLDIAFDPAILGFNNVEYGDFALGDQLDLFGLGIITETTAGTGTVNLFELSFDLPDDLNDLQAGAFTLATLRFDALAAGTGVLSLTVTTLADADGNPLTADSLGTGSVTVEARQAVPEPGTLLLLAVGLAGIFGRALGDRRQAHRNSLPRPARHPSTE